MLLTYWWINHEVSFYGLEKHGLEKNSCAHMRSYTSMCEGIYVAVSLKTDNDKGTMLDFQRSLKQAESIRHLWRLSQQIMFSRKILDLEYYASYHVLTLYTLKEWDSRCGKIFSKAWHWDIFFMLPSGAETFAPGRVKPFARFCGWFCLCHSHVKHFRIVLFWQKQLKCDVWVHKTAFLVLRHLTWGVALGSFDPNSKLIVGVKWLWFV